MDNGILAFIFFEARSFVSGGAPENTEELYDIMSKTPFGYQIEGYNVTGDTTFIVSYG